MIRNALKKPGKSQKGLAMALNVDPSAITRLTQGKRKLQLHEIGPLARYLGIDRSELGEAAATVGDEKHPHIIDVGPDSFALVPVYDARASAGPGSVGTDEIVSRIAFRMDWLRLVTRAPVEDLGVIMVDGDSMEPTLRHNDIVLIDLTQRNVIGREGIYVIRIDDCLQVKRVAANPVARTVTLGSDNPVYPAFANIRPEDINVLGRVIWLGRQVAG